MRVLHVIARMNIGGTATYLLNLIDGLENLGARTKLVVGHVPFNEKEDSRLRNYEFLRVKELSREISPLKDFSSLLQIKDIIKKTKPDIIHTHTFKAGALVRTLNSNVPVIHTFHGHHLYDPDYGRIKKNVLNTLERSLARKTARIVTIGDKVGRELLEAGIGKAEQYISIPPGVAKPELASRGDVLQGLNIKDSFNVLWMGRLTHVKRPDRVIEIAKRFSNFNFIIAGDGELREKCISSAPPNAYFVGVQNANKMWSIADVVLLTSDSEGMPLTLIEGQMAGVSAVATNVGSVSEVVIDGETGLLAKPDLDDLSSQLKAISSNNLRRLSMSMGAQKRAREYFSIESMAMAHSDLYQSLLKEKSA